jgi:hypothetical protein
MKMPPFTAQASLYRTSNRYRSSVTDFGGSIADQSVVAAYIPGPRTQNRCSGCTDICVGLRNICLAEVSFTVAQACWASLGFGCGAAIAWGYVKTGGCYAHYAKCFGLCQIPSNPIWESPCCPKVCGIHIPGIAGSGCCDHGEACVGSHNPNTRDGCCPVGRECYGNCCAEGEHCLPGGVCSRDPGYLIPEDTSPPPPPPFSCPPGSAPCGLPDITGVIRTCCPPGTVCCGLSPNGQPICRFGSGTNACLN